MSRRALGVPRPVEAMLAGLPASAFGPSLEGGVARAWADAARSSGRDAALLLAPLRALRERRFAPAFRWPLDAPATLLAAVETSRACAGASPALASEIFDHAATLLAAWARWNAPLLATEPSESAARLREILRAVLERAIAAHDAADRSERAGGVVDEEPDASSTADDSKSTTGRSRRFSSDETQRHIPRQITPGSTPLAAELGVTPALCLACVAASPACDPETRFEALGAVAKICAAVARRRDREGGLFLDAPPGAAARSSEAAFPRRTYDLSRSPRTQRAALAAYALEACEALRADEGKPPGEVGAGARLRGAAATLTRSVVRATLSLFAGDPLADAAAATREAEAGAALIDAIAGTCAGYPAATLAVAEAALESATEARAGTTTLAEPRGGPSSSETSGGFRAPPPIRACPDAFAGGVAACAGASLAAVRLRNDAGHPWVGSTLAPAAKVAAEALRVAAEVSEGLLVASALPERGSTRPGSTTFSPLVDAVAAAWASRLGVNDDAASTSRDVPRRRFPRLDRVAIARNWTGACHATLGLARCVAEGAVAVPRGPRGSPALRAIAVGFGAALAAPAATLFGCAAAGADPGRSGDATLAAARAPLPRNAAALCEAVARRAAADLGGGVPREGGGVHEYDANEHGTNEHGANEHRANEYGASSSSSSLARRREVHAASSFVRRFAVEFHETYRSFRASADPGWLARLDAAKVAPAFEAAHVALLGVARGVRVLRVGVGAGPLAAAASPSSPAPPFFDAYAYPLSSSSLRGNPRAAALVSLADALARLEFARSAGALPAYAETLRDLAEAFLALPEARVLFCLDAFPDGRELDARFSSPSSSRATTEPTGDGGFASRGDRAYPGPTDRSHADQHRSTPSAASSSVAWRDDVVFGTRVHLLLRLFPYAAGNVPATILRLRAMPCANRCLAHPRAAVVRAAHVAHVAAFRAGGVAVAREWFPEYVAKSLEGFPLSTPLEPFAAALSAVASASGDDAFFNAEGGILSGEMSLADEGAMFAEGAKRVGRVHGEGGDSGNPAFLGESSRLVVDAARRVAEKAAALDADANANADANAAGVSKFGFQNRALPPAVSAAAADALRGVVFDLLGVVPHAAVPAARRVAEEAVLAAGGGGSGGGRAREAARRARSAVRGGGGARGLREEGAERAVGAEAQEHDLRP